MKLEDQTLRKASLKNNPCLLFSECIHAPVLYNMVIQRARSVKILAQSLEFDICKWLEISRLGIAHPVSSSRKIACERRLVLFAYYIFCCQILTKMGKCRPRENLFSCYPVIIYGQSDRHA